MLHLVDGILWKWGTLPTFQKTSYIAFKNNEGTIYLLHIEVDVRAHWSQVQRLWGPEVVSQRCLRMFAITLL
jgi:hypothetical protein